jgi:homoserine O-acetyltransferase
MPERLRNTPAWQPGDEPGNRRFAQVFTSEFPLKLASGGELGPVVMAYETFGTLAADRSNAVLIQAPLTMDTNIAGPAGPGHPVPGWWDAVVGPGKALDTDRFFVVSPDPLGGCRGSTGPAGRDSDGRPWGSRFPVIGLDDQVRTEAALANQLGIARWHTIIGMSIGGTRALEWAISQADRTGGLLLIAAGPATNMELAALARLEVELIRNDPHFHGGDYYELPEGCGPRHGLMMARSISHVRYGSEQYWQRRFGGDRWYTNADSCHDEFFGYLLAQGEKVTKRFDANSYAVLTSAAVNATVARGRPSIAAALRMIQCPVHIVGFTTDRAYPLYMQEELAARIPAATLTAVETDLGHYAFLFAPQLIERDIRAALSTPR